MSDRPTVLVADDEPSMRLILGIGLKDPAYNVCMVSDGEEALAMARAIHPKVALIDIRMPGKDGYEVCRALKADPATADTTVILLTAYIGASTRRKSYAAGADQFIEKPLSPNELRERVRYLIA